MGQRAAPAQVAGAAVERPQDVVVGHDVDALVVGYGRRHDWRAGAPAPAGAAAREIEAVQRAGRRADEELIVERGHAGGDAIERARPDRAGPRPGRAPRSARRRVRGTGCRARARAPRAPRRRASARHSSSPSAARNAARSPPSNDRIEPARCPSTAAPRRCRAARAARRPRRSRRAARGHRRRQRRTRGRRPRPRAAPSRSSPASARRPCRDPRPPAGRRASRRKPTARRRPGASQADWQPASSSADRGRLRSAATAQVRR